MAVLEFLRKACRANRAVAFADKKLRGTPPVVGFKIFVDELAKRPDVPCLTVKLRGVDAGDDTAVAGVDGVDEYKIGNVNEGVFVVREVERGSRLEALVRKLHVFGSEGSHVQPNRGGTWSAVVEK